MNNIKVIAFDFFDTLVHRDCSPETVIYEWARQMAAYSKFEVSSYDFYNQRKFIENKFLDSDREEITYHELINSIFDTFSSKLSLIQKNTFFDEAIKTEVNAELNHLSIDKQNFALLREYSKTCKIVIISDFYCSKEFFKRILEHFNIMDYVSNIYVSSDIGKRKSTGQLYKFVLSDLSILSNELMMIGDNFQSDNLIPRELGIITKHINYKISNNVVTTKRTNKILKKARKNSLFSGYAPVILLFLNRLYKESVKNNVDSLLFCAREGQNLIYLFNEFQKILYPQHIIKTRYFYVSRRATLLPSLADIGKENFYKILRQYKELFVGDFLFSIGFSNEDIDELYKFNIVRPDDLVTYKNNYAIVNQLCKNSLFINKYNTYRLNSKSLFQKYLHQLVGDTKRIAIVDIGWKGTIQDNIRSIIDHDCYILGYYFGLNEDSISSENNKKEGLIFDYKLSTPNCDIFSYNCIHLERVFAADHGPTIGYKLKDNEVIPVLDKSLKDIEIFNYINKMQKQMNKTILDLIHLFSKSSLDIEDFTYQITKNYLFYLMNDVPKNYKTFLTFRKKVKENFGNISNKKVEVERAIVKDKKMKKKFLYVDYTYRFLDKFHLFIFYPFASLYCKVSYIIKKMSIKR